MYKRLKRIASPVLILLLLPLSSSAEEELDHQTPGSLRVSLVLSPGDSEAIFGVFMALWMREVGGPFPKIVAQEPGPLELAGGLRLLPNEVPPRIETPQLLVVVNSGNFQPTDLFLAFLRRCLALGTQIWFVGPFPDPLIELALEPGQEMISMSAEDLGPALRNWCDR